MKYLYRCEEAGCNRHEQTLIDWESGVLALKSLERYDWAVAKELQRRKFLDEMCATKKDTYFFVGNQHQFPRSFLVLGVFWPPRNSRPQQPLFEF